MAVSKSTFEELTQRMSREYDALTQAAAGLAAPLDSLMTAYYSEGRSIKFYSNSTIAAANSVLDFAQADHLATLIDFLNNCTGPLKLASNENFHHADPYYAAQALNSKLQQKSHILTLLGQFIDCPAEFNAALAAYLFALNNGKYRHTEYAKAEELKTLVATTQAAIFAQVTLRLSQAYMTLNRGDRTTDALHTSLPLLLSRLYKQKHMQDPALLLDLFRVMNAKALDTQLIGNLLSVLEKLKQTSPLRPELQALIQRHLLDNTDYLHISSASIQLQTKDRIAEILKASPSPAAASTAQSAPSDPEHAAQSELSLPLDSRSGIDKWSGDYLSNLTWPLKIAEEINALGRDEKLAWYALWHYAATAKTTTPTATWLKKGQLLVDALGAGFNPLISHWLGLIQSNSPKSDPPFSEKNTAALKGLCWLCTLQPADSSAQAIGAMVHFSYGKLVGLGARSSIVANSGLYALGYLGNAGIVQLSKLRGQVKYSTGLKLIEKALTDAAQRQGVTADDLEEIAVPELDIVAGQRSFKFGEVQATLRLYGAKSAEVDWQDAAGQPLKAIPASSKSAFAAELKDLKKITTEVSTILTGQAQRLEDSILKQRVWPLDAWQQRFVDHGILGWLGRRLIWRFDDQGSVQHGIWQDNQLLDAAGQPLAALSPETRASLWHPIFASVAEVQAWRLQLRERQIVQPFKQAFREVYLLTPAEEQTAVYSNRFAFHLLKQHQFSALCRERGWSYQLQGGWDGHNTPQRLLPHWQIGARLKLDSNIDTPMTDHGIFQHVLTAAVEFYPAGSPYQAIPISTVPALVFSELMRDIDLFVGVCSIGVDPNLDLSPPAVLSYFNRLNSADLTASAQIRKDVLDNIISKLTIADRCTFDGKYLVVTGSKRTYNIHLGSGNILMEPNAQYLCIVQDAKKTDAATQNLYLPFEGDHMLAIILSKALLLANDASIKDASILAQINRT